MNEREEARRLQKEKVREMEKHLLNAAAALDKAEMTAEEANALSAVVRAFVELKRFSPY